jgi:hypothetical protein
MPDLTPKTIVQSPFEFDKFDFQKEVAKYEKEPKKSIHIIRVKADKRPLKLSLVGEVTSDGIVVSNEYGTHSLGFKFSDDEDLETIEQFNVLFEQFKLDDSWTAKDFIKNDTLWIKLKYPKDKSSYKFTSNVKLNPKKPADTPFRAYHPVELLVELLAYINMEDKMYGFSINLIDLKSLDHSTTTPPSKRARTE